MIEAVVFDLDGTLVHLPIDYELMFREFKRIMRVKNVHPVLEVVSKADAATRKRVFEVWEKVELASSVNLKVNDEGMKLYGEFAGKPKALVTMQGRKLVANVAEKMSLNFDVVATREDSLSRVEQLKRAIMKLAKNARNVLFVGNTDCDADAAKEVGCQFLLVKQN